MTAHSNGTEVVGGIEAGALGSRAVSNPDRDAVQTTSHFVPENDSSALGKPGPIRLILISVLVFAALAAAIWRFGLARSYESLSKADTAADSYKKVTDIQAAAALKTSPLPVTQNACSLLTLGELSEGLGSNFAEAVPSRNGDDEISCEYSPGEGNIYPASLTVTLQNGKVAMETLRGVGTKIISGTNAESDLGDASFYMPMDVGIYALKGDTLVSLQFGLGRGTREQKQALVRKVLSRL